MRKITVGGGGGHHPERATPISLGSRQVANLSHLEGNAWGVGEKKDILGATERDCFAPRKEAGPADAGGAGRGQSTDVLVCRHCPLCRTGNAALPERAEEKPGPRVPLRAERSGSDALWHWRQHLLQEPSSDGSTHTSVSAGQGSVPACQLSLQVQPPQAGAKGQWGRWPKWPQVLGGRANLPSWATLGLTHQGFGQWLPAPRSSLAGGRLPAC